MKKTAVRKDILGGGGVILIILLTVLFGCENFLENTNSTTHDHQWGDWVQLSAATCDEAEKLIRTCLLDPTQSEYTTGEEALGHDWDEETTIPATETENGKKVTICKNDTEHIIESDEFSGEYATGTPGLAYALLTGTNANTYRVSKGTFNGSAVHIPAYYRSNADSSYLPVRQVNNGTLNTTSNSAFGGATSNVAAVTFAEESQITTISAFAFYALQNLASITLPESLTSIGNGAFQRTGLTAITIPEGVTSIGSSAFNDCKSLTSVTIPDSVTVINSSVFSGCTNLVSINFPEGATFSGGDQFYGCSKLESITFLPTNITAITSRMFYECFGLTNITIPEGVKSIDFSAFDGCINLASVTLPEGLTSIGQYAFQYCEKLTSVIIPASVTSISSYAFYKTGITSITFEGNGITTINLSGSNHTFVPDGYESFRSVYNSAVVKAGTYTFNGTEWEKTSEL